MGDASLRSSFVFVFTYDIVGISCIYRYLACLCLRCSPLLLSVVVVFPVVFASSPELLSSDPGDRTYWEKLPAKVRSVLPDINFSTPLIPVVLHSLLMDSALRPVCIIL